MELEEIKQKINNALDELYDESPSLFDENLCLCERCINHRFAVYLEKQNFGNEYFVDCEYNKSRLNKKSELKEVSNENGNYIDIIISKRDGKYKNDFICFEVKKWNNYKGRDKDRRNLEILTGGKDAKNNIRFGYDYGFYIIFGEKREEVKEETYLRRGKGRENKNYE